MKDIDMKESMFASRSISALRPIDTSIRYALRRKSVSLAKRSHCCAKPIKNQTERGGLVIFKLVIDQQQEEQIVATVHKRTQLIAKIEELVSGEGKTDVLTGYDEEDTVFLKPSQVECVFVEEGRTFAVCSDGKRYRLKGRLYELEARLGPEFVRINKSALANWNGIRRFKASIAGAVDIEFKSGYTEYVSRRCFAELKRRFGL